MEVIFYNLLKVDNEENTVSIESFANKQNIQNYIWDLITNCVDTKGDREYIFDPNLQTTKTHIDNIIQDNNRDDVCKLLAEKLLSVENDTKEKIAHLEKEIPKGILMISFTKMTDTEYKLIITKADYTEFLEELSGEKKSGLPTKKKIFKSFIMNVSCFDGKFEYAKILTYDANSKKATYWWKTFLELSEVRDDVKNTKTAYDAIKKDIIEPLRRKHKQDYLCLRNATIAYFRAEGDFDIDHYRDAIIGNYKPFDNSLNIEDIKIKIEKLPQKYDFDNSFQKTPTVITDRFKDTIFLTEGIELKLMQDILDINRVIKPHRDDEGKEYIMILSTDGYQYAIGLDRKQNE
ncbi:nucleoid-associated protein [Treponema pedis]|uniref:nucleoid-associated protein n=1 Tax=Treponema pedis TaxID=409322 RepID=UPI000410B732|nr:nucleoid-associated protein [Treponema pedis]